MLKRKLMFSLFTVLALLFSAICPAQATEKSLKEPRDFRQYLEQQISLSNNAKQKKSLEMILEMQKVTEEQIRRSIKKTEPSELQAADVDVYLGRDCDFYAAEGGGRGGSGLYSVDFDLNNNRNLVKVWSVINNSSGWAWNGKVFKVNGTGSQIASFSIEGYYSAYLNFAPDTGASSIGGVDFKLYDLTEDREVASKSIATFIPPFDGSGQTFTENYSRLNVFQVELKAGHYYRAYLITQGYTVINGVFNSYELSTNKYSDWYRIQIDF